MPANLDPIDLSVGAYYLTETDVSLPGLAGLDLNLARHYHSGNNLNGPFGQRWDSPLFMRLVTAAGNAPATYYNGRMRIGMTFTVASQTPTLVAYNTPVGSYFDLKKQLVSPNVWNFVLTQPHGEKITFEFALIHGSEYWYRLKSITDPNENAISVVYSAITGFPRSGFIRV